MDRIRGEQLPTISIVIPTYNEERNIARCLDSIFRQEYPSTLLEVFVVDNESTDRTVDIARAYPVHLLFNREIHDAQWSKMIAFRKATGDYFIYLDADIELRGTQWFQKMLLPLLDDPTIIGSFTKKYQISGDNTLNRFLTYDELQRDPVYQFFSPPIQETIQEVRKGYFVCQYTLGNIPPAGRCLYRRKELLKTPIAHGEKFMELDNLVLLVKSGHDRFAYVPEAGLYHHHAQSISSLVRKRLRNIQRNYLPEYTTRHYRWFDIGSIRGMMKIFLWLLYAHSIIFPFLCGMYKAIKYRDSACIWYEVVLTIVLTDVIVYGFLRHLNGWRLLSTHIRKFSLWT